MRSWDVPFYVPYVDDREKEALARVIDSKNLSMGEEVEAFEKEAAHVLGAPEGHECVAVSSATAGLYLLQQILFNNPEHPESRAVAVPNLTFCATINSVLAAGNKPVICDVDDKGIMLCPEELNLDGAIYATYAGYLPENLPHSVLVDQAHSFQSGAYRENSVWSFYGNKNIAAGEGGLIGVDCYIGTELRRMRDHGRYMPDAVTHPGSLNFRMSELQAAVLRVQLEKLPEIMDHKDRIRAIYDEKLKRHVMIPDVLTTHLYWIRVPSEKRDRIKAFMIGTGIECSIHYKPLSRFDCYKKYVPDGADLSFSESFGAEVLSLPFWPGMSDRNAEFVADILLEALKLA